MFENRTPALALCMSIELNVESYKTNSSLH